MSLDDLSYVAEIYGCDGKLNFLCSLDLIPTPLIKNCPNTTKRWLRVVPNLVTQDIGINSGYQELQTSPDTLNFINMTDTVSECSDNHFFSGLQNERDTDLGLQNVGPSVQDFLSNSRSTDNLNDASCQLDHNIPRTNSSDDNLQHTQPVTAFPTIRRSDSDFQGHVDSKLTGDGCSASSSFANNLVNVSCYNNSNYTMADSSMMSELTSQMSNSPTATFVSASPRKTSPNQDKSRNSSMSGTASPFTCANSPVFGKLLDATSSISTPNSMRSIEVVSPSAGPFFSGATTAQPFSSTTDKLVSTSTHQIPVTAEPMRTDQVSTYSGAGCVQAADQVLSSDRENIQAALPTTQMMLSSNQMVTILTYADSGIVTSLVDHKGLAKHSFPYKHKKEQHQQQQQQQEQQSQQQQHQQEQLHHHQQLQQQQLLQEQLSSKPLLSQCETQSSNKTNNNNKTSKNCILVFQSIKEAVLNEIVSQEINQTIFAEVSIGKTQGYLSELLRSSKHLERKDQKDYCRTRHNLKKIKMFLRKPKHERMRIYNKAKSSKLKCQNKESCENKEPTGGLLSDNQPLSSGNGVAAVVEPGSSLKKKTRTIISEDAKKYMCEYFTQIVGQKSNLSKDEVQNLASHVSLEVANVKIFYKNWKQRTKMKS